MATKEKEFVPTEEDNTTLSAAQRDYKEQTKSLIARLRSEPKRKVHGSEAFKSSLGTVWTWLYCGYPVSIRFDGTYQEFPETIANALERKLANIARNISSKEVNVKIQGF